MKTKKIAFVITLVITLCISISFSTADLTNVNSSKSDAVEAMLIIGVNVNKTLIRSFDRLKVLSIQVPESLKGRMSSRIHADMAYLFPGGIDTGEKEITSFLRERPQENSLAARLCAILRGSGILNFEQDSTHSLAEGISIRWPGETNTGLTPERVLRHTPTFSRVPVRHWSRLCFPSRLNVDPHDGLWQRLDQMGWTRAGRQKEC